MTQTRMLSWLAHPFVRVESFRRSTTEAPQPLNEQKRYFPEQTRGGNRA